MREGASQFSDMGRMPMPRGTGILPVDLQKSEMRPMRDYTKIAAWKLADDLAVAIYESLGSPLGS